MFFSLFWQREGTKRDHVARSGQNKSDSSKLCCGTRFAQTVLALPDVTVFQSSHLLPSLSLSQPFKVKGQRNSVKGSLPFREGLGVGSIIMPPL